MAEGNSTNTCIRSFTFLVAKSPWTSIKPNQTLTTHNANRHCRARFFHFCGTSFAKTAVLVNTLSASVMEINDSGQQRYSKTRRRLFATLYVASRPHEQFFDFYLSHKNFTCEYTSK